MPTLVVAEQENEEKSKSLLMALTPELNSLEICPASVNADNMC